MTYGAFLNKKCSWRRKGQSTDPPTYNAVGEEVLTNTTIAENVKCRLEKLYDRDVVEAFGGGDHEKAIYCLYLPLRMDIRGEDIVTIADDVPDFKNVNSNSNELMVMDVDDAGGGKGHHLECFCRYREEIS